MNLELKLINALYRILSKNLKCKVYSNVPNDALTPFVRIGEVEVSNWLLLPKSSIVSLTLSTFSELSSASEVITIAGNIKDILRESFNHANVEFIMECYVGKEDVFQLTNRTWVAELKLEIYAIN